jgi:hypothetical protein
MPNKTVKLAPNSAAFWVSLSGMPEKEVHAIGENAAVTQSTPRVLGEESLRN